MILITGASGTLGSEIVKELQATKAPFRAAYFSKDKANAAQENGVDTVVIDYQHPETLREALTGIDAMFLLGPNLLHQTQLELGAVEAAKAAGVRHIVKQSVLGAEQEDFSLSRVHL